MVYAADTIAALATPTGTSALAILRISGPLAAGLVTAIFGTTPLPRQVCRGDYCNQAGSVLDDALYVFFQGPHSYTGEDILEISCHGNPFLAGKILEDVYLRGCRPAEPGEFTKRAFLNGRMDLSQAEAVVDLIHARSDRALSFANKQLRGSLGSRMRALVDTLLNLLARVEAYIDFPEEDLPSEDRTIILTGVQQLLADTGRLLATTHYGEILRDGMKAVILGEPNAGKSSLLNRLVGMERALVSSEPGTTRDYIEERLTLGSHCIRLIDTAGLNPSPAPLEQLGMNKTLERAVEADLILLVLDATQPAPILPSEIASRLTPQNSLVVINKIDLLPGSPYPTLGLNNSEVKVSALTGEGCEALVAAIVRQAEAFQAEQGEDVVAVNARHAHALAQAMESLSAVLKKIPAGEPAELLASDLRNACYAFEDIMGKIDNEQVLDRLFKTFCIGK